MSNKSIKFVVILVVFVSLISAIGYLVFKTNNLSKLNAELSKSLSDKTSSLNTKIGDLDNKQQNKDEELQAKNEELEKKISCQELIKKTPDTGNYDYINRDIVGYYKDAVETLNRVKANPTRPEDSEDAKAELKFRQSNVDKAKPLYDYYISQCGTK